MVAVQCESGHGSSVTLWACIITGGSDDGVVVGLSEGIAKKNMGSKDTCVEVAYSRGTLGSCEDTVGEVDHKLLLFVAVEVFDGVKESWSPDFSDRHGSERKDLQGAS